MNLGHQSCWIWVAILGFAVACSTDSFAQNKAPLECKKQVLAALKPIPKLQYHCEGENDWDDKFLKLPNRQAALTAYKARLAGMVYPAWWAADVDELNVCAFHRKAGPLSKEEQNSYGDYAPQVFGDSRIRVVRSADPCYQTEFGGSDLFLLHRHNGKIYVSEIVDGFFSRADSPIFGVSVLRNGAEEIVELATWSGGLYPEQTNYYFTINAKSMKAVPKKLFLLGGQPANQISSAMIPSSMKDLDKPEDWEPLGIETKDKKLANEFCSYDRVLDDPEHADIQVNNEGWNRTVFKWNGRFYEERPAAR